MNPISATGERLFPVDPAVVGSVWSVRGNRARWRAPAGQDVRRTPKALFEELHAEFDFTVDVAALPDNALCPRYFTPDTDGLAQDWTGERCWMNPPYSEIGRWTEKAAASGALVVGLLPVRTDLGWFHDDVLAAGAEVRFIKGRVRFSATGVDGDGPLRHNAPFPSMVVVWGGGAEMTRQEAEDWLIGPDPGVGGCPHGVSLVFPCHSCADARSMLPKNTSGSGGDA